MKDEMRLIDAYKLEDLVRRNRASYHNKDDVIAAIAGQPTVDAAPVVHAHWEPGEDVPGFVRCSHCRDCNIYEDWPDGKKWNYCPNCGARMDGGADHDGRGKG